MLFKLFCRKHFLADFGFLFSSRVADTHKKTRQRGSEKAENPLNQRKKKAGTTNLPKISRQYLSFKLPFCDLNHGLYFRITFLEKAFADAKVKDELLKGVLAEFRVWQKNDSHTTLLQHVLKLCNLWFVIVIAYTRNRWIFGILNPKSYVKRSLTTMN